MFENSARSRRLLGAVTASVFGLGMGALVGVVPGAGDVTTVRTADAQPPGMDETVVVPVETVPDATTTVVTPVTEAAPVADTTLEPAPEPAVEPPPPAPRPEVVEAPVAVAPPAPPPGPVPVPRRQPSAAEVDRAIAGVRPYVRSLLPVNPTHAQVAELGDKICTAFDQGQTLAQVKATGAELVKKVPFATLLAGGDDYIVRTGVALYCPGHADKLG